MISKMICRGKCRCIDAMLSHDHSRYIDGEVVMGKVRVTVEFDDPGHPLEDCMKLVMNQMRAIPEWEEMAGTGRLNYVCHDPELRIVAAEKE